MARGSGEITVALAVIAATVDQVRRAGLDVEDFVRRLGLDPALLQDPTARVPVSSVAFAAEVAAELTGDPDFGLHAGENVDERTFGLMTYACAAQATLREALEAAARYFRLLAEVRSLRLEVRGRDAVFSTDADLPIPAAAMRHGTEMVLAINQTFCSRLAGDRYRTREVRFAHPAPPRTDEHARIFGCPVRFEAGEDSMTFDAELLDLPLRSLEPTLASIVRAAAEDALARVPPSTPLTAEVRRRLPDLLAQGDAGLEATARALGTSARTLQRRLREEGTSHSEILDHVRRELAVSYLAREEMSAAEVAFLVGFSEPASFNRAFKRWTGTTPSRHRRRSTG